MSLESWKKDHYPIPADQAAKGTHSEALKHSINKWRGLDKHTLFRHQLTTDKFGVVEISEPFCELPFLDLTCSLCCKYRNYQNDEESSECKNCLVYEECGHNCICSYKDFPDPTSMLELLTSCRAYAKQRDAYDAAKKSLEARL